MLTIASKHVPDRVQVFFLQAASELEDCESLESSKAFKTFENLPFTAPYAPEKTEDRQNTPFKPTADDEACAKLWSVYIGEAQRYDEELLKGWKQDMEGTLLFSALYSASLTAFLIESYQTLQDDPAQNTVNLLIQISQQLAAVSNGTIPPFQPIPAFLSARANVLAAGYFRAAVDPGLPTQNDDETVTHSSSQSALLPIRRITDFGMHNLVDLIPILLHTSLFFFFAGLVSFLLPVNRPLVYIMAIILAIFLVIYAILTCIPLLYLDAPYHTPLSRALWRIGNTTTSYLVNRHGLVHEGETLTEAILEKSLQDVTERDRSALIYTIRASNDERELLPFIEAISDALCDTRRYSTIRWHNVPLIMPLLETCNPEVNILSRISQFLEKSGSAPEGGYLACSRALWSLSYMLASRGAQRLRLNSNYIPAYREFVHMAMWEFSRVDCPLYKYSAFSAMRFGWLCSLRNSIDNIEKFLLNPEIRITNSERIRRRFALVSEDVKHFRSVVSQDELVFSRLYADGVRRIAGNYPCPYAQLIEVIGNGTNSSNPLEELTELEDVIAPLREDTTWKLMRAHVLLEYLLISQDLVLSGTLPHAFEDMCEDIYPNNKSVIDLDDVGALASHHAAPLLGLKRQLAETQLVVSDLTDTIMVQYSRLFFTIKHAWSETSEAAEARNFVIWYLAQRGDDICVESEYDDDDFARIGDCIIKSFLHEAVQLDLLSKAAWCCLTNHNLRLNTDFVPRLWDALRNVSGFSKDSKENNYSFMKGILHQAILHHFTSQHGQNNEDESSSESSETMSLDNEYLPDYLPLASFPSHAKPRESSFIIAMASCWIDLSRNCDSSGLLKASSDITRWGTMAFGEVDEKRQIAFGQSISNVVKDLVDGDSYPVPFRCYAALDSIWTNFESWDGDFTLDRKTERTWNWGWITSVECATIIADAIGRYKESPAYRFPSEEGQENLLARCREVIEGAAGLEESGQKDKETKENLVPSRSE
ncbi:hypothetical protein D9758_005445 [Tetrapyrgos nigripes]|uniref:DUF6535 domain-containing protein n=1 Tax=Tetrapyrgos nigripes TaxID=182062 RepID=A0A8H5LQ28_9AGAR|nr:hypothetical protein D9758_005445 [Tetrapyrgos nigripes]